MDNNEEIGDEGFSLTMMVFLIFLGFMLIIFGTDYFSLFIKHQSVEAEIERTISQVIMEEVDDHYLMEGKLIVRDINSTKLKLENEIKRNVKDRQKLDLENLTVDVTNPEKVFVNVKGRVVLNVMTAKNIDLPVSVSSRGKAQRFDIED